MYRYTIYHFRTTKMQKMLDELRKRKAKEKEETQS